MWVAGVDGCRGGWVAFRVVLPNFGTTVELIDLPAVLGSKPDQLATLAIDIPIGLPDHPRACDIAARERLGWPRRNSAFSPPCRAALAAKNHGDASAINRRITNRGLSQQAWGIAPKIKQVDDAITPKCQPWAFEVHPEICFWALAGEHPMLNRKKTADGVNERLKLLRREFPDIERHLSNRPSGIAKDDLLDAAVAAWTAMRFYERKAATVCEPERDARGLLATIYF
jgi:predicted RNase H-like nuclease